LVEKFASLEKNQSYYEPYISTDFYLHVQSMRKNKGGSEIWATEAEILAEKPLWSFSESVTSTSEHEFFLNQRCKIQDLFP
jgi:hypothetical protein